MFVRMYVSRTWWIFRVKVWREKAIDPLDHVFLNLARIQTCVTQSFQLVLFNIFVHIDPDFLTRIFFLLWTMEGTQSSWIEMVTTCLPSMEQLRRHSRLKYAFTFVSKIVRWDSLLFLGLLLTENSLESSTFLLFLLLLSYLSFKGLILP